MHARLISFSGADPEKRENAIQTIRETVVPMLREYDGFAGYIALYDAQNRRAKAVLLWESEDAAEAAEETLAERRQQLASGIGLTVESADLYEAPVVELETARVKRVDGKFGRRRGRSRPSRAPRSFAARSSARCRGRTC
jgi:hypothetical protein